MKDLWSSVIDEVTKATPWLFPDSVNVEFGTNRPGNDTDDYMIIRYGDDNSTGFKFDGHQIKNSRTSVTPGYSINPTIKRAIYIHEFTRTIGFTGYVPDSQPSVGNSPAVLPHLNDFDKNCIKLLYARPYGSKTPDTNP